jgi:hypothetical protein
MCRHLFSVYEIINKLERVPSSSGERWQLYAVYIFPDMLFHQQDQMARIKWRKLGRGDISYCTLIVLRLNRPSSQACLDEVWNGEISSKLPSKLRNCHSYRQGVTIRIVQRCQECTRNIRDYLQHILQTGWVRFHLLCVEAVGWSVPLAVPIFSRRVTGYAFTSSAKELQRLAGTLKNLLITAQDCSVMQQVTQKKKISVATWVMA